MTSIRTKPLESFVGDGAEARVWLAEGRAPVEVLDVEEVVPKFELRSGAAEDVGEELGLGVDGPEVPPPAAVAAPGKIDCEPDEPEPLEELAEDVVGDPELGGGA